MDRLVKLLRSAGGLSLMALVLLAGCADDLYAPCQLDANSADPSQAACGATDGVDRGCVVDNYITCDTRSCGRYAGSDPFCTKICTDNSECPSGQCVELVFQTGRKYCVLDELL